MNGKMDRFTRNKRRENQEDFWMQKDAEDRINDQLGSRMEEIKSTASERGSEFITPEKKESEKDLDLSDESKKMAEGISGPKYDPAKLSAPKIQIADSMQARRKALMDILKRG